MPSKFFATVGFGKNVSNAINDANDVSVLTYGASYNVNDQISVSIASGKVDKDGEASDEEHKTLQVGYDLGGMGITLGYYEVENLGYTAGSDSEKIEIRTIFVILSFSRKWNQKNNKKKRYFSGFAMSEK